VARVLVGDRQLEGVELRQLCVTQRLRDVERREAFLLQVRAAAGGVDHDRVEALEAPPETVGEPRRLVRAPGVRGQRATAALRRRDHLVARGGEHPGCRRIHLAEDDGLHAAGE
jgi:hypothetical protein